jgi:hypothetical protein
VVDEVAQGQVFLRVLLFSLSVLFHQIPMLIIIIIVFFFFFFRLLLSETKKGQNLEFFKQSSAIWRKKDVAVFSFSSHNVRKVARPFFYLKVPWLCPLVLLIRGHKNGDKYEALLE